MRTIKYTALAFFFTTFSLISYAELNSVPQEKLDQDIKTRVVKITDATNWYPNLKIDVREGLVFLDGQIESNEKAEWLKNVVNNTEGVVAIVDNTITISAKETSVLSPARKEAQEVFLKSQTLIPYIISSFAIFIIFIFLAFITRVAISTTLRKRQVSPLINQAIVNTVFVLFILVGTYFSLKSSGLSGLAYTILGGTGALGLGLGLALKSTLENYISGIMISMKGVFRKGEVVVINGHEGVVQTVTSRGTTLMDFEGNSIVIPNTEVFNSTIKNLTRNPNMRTDFTVGIGYESSIDQAKNIIYNELSHLNRYILDDPKSMVTVEELGAATVILRIYFWFNAIEFNRFKVRSLIIEKVKEALMREHISMPDDAREVVFASPLEIINSDNDSDKSLASKSSKKKPEGDKKPVETVTENHEDLSNNLDEIHRQALNSESAEKGEDLLNPKY